MQFLEETSELCSLETDSKNWFASVTQIDTWQTETYLISASTKNSAYWTLMGNLDTTWNLDHLEPI